MNVSGSISTKSIFAPQYKAALAVETKVLDDVHTKSPLPTPIARYAMWRAEVALETAFAYFILLPNQFIYFLKSAFSSIFLFSNLFFHYTGESYGQSILTTIPLLHTWSLSLEEQFYIFYPAFLILLFKYGKNKINISLIILLLISILFSLSINKNHGSFNFYMLPSRGWEFIVGGLLAINEGKKTYNFNNNIKNFLSFLGFFLILYSFIFF